MEHNNPYQAPGANVHDVTAGGIDETGPFSPAGRFGRLSYLAWSMVINFSLGMVMAIVAGIVGASMQDPGAIGGILGILLLVIEIAIVVVAIMFSIRRFHDFNASGWWTLLMLVPVVNFITGLVLLFKPGTIGPNDFGPPRITRAWEKVVGYIAIGIMILALLGIVAAVLMPMVASQ